MSLKALEETHDSYYRLIKAAEGFAPRYKKSPKEFDALMGIEARMHRKLVKYFKGLSTRVPKYIDWAKYDLSQLNASVIKGGAFNVEIDTELSDEDNLFLNIVYDDLAEGIAVGAAAADALYGQAADLPQHSATVQKLARTQSAKLVTNISSTTRERIRESLATSQHLGENQIEAANRMTDVLNDPDRALMIAQTESVNSWSLGTLAYGQDTSAVSKSWEALDTASDEACAGNNGETVGIDESFPSGDDAPPAHPNCRCVVYLNYANGDSSESDG